MANKTNCCINGIDYYRLQRKVGKRLNEDGLWVDHIKSFYGKSKKEAEQKYSDYMKHINKVIDTNDCLGEIIDSWIETTFKTSNLANATKVKYIRAYDKIFRRCNSAGKLISDVTAIDLQKIYNESTECYSTRRALHNMLVNFYNYAVMNKLCEVNPTKGLNVPSEDILRDNNIEVWKNEDISRLIRALEGDRLRLLVVLAVNTGARFGELLALKYSDIKDNCLLINKQVSGVNKLDDEVEKGPHMTETKTSNSNRMIPLSDKVLSEIEKHQEWQRREMQDMGYKTDLLFTTKNGTLYYQRNIIRSLKRTCDANGIPWKKFHAFRSTFATNLSQQGVPMETLKALMGHRSIETTAEYYVSIDANRKREAIESIEKYTLNF